jgi:hypothetical protein
MRSLDVFPEFHSIVHDLMVLGNLEFSQWVEAGSHLSGQIKKFKANELVVGDSGYT